MKQPLSHSSLDELNKLAELSAKIKQRKVKLILNTTKKVLEEAEHMSRLGDEENSYIFYMKYFNLITIIQKSKELHKGDLREFLGTNSDINKRFDVLEKLKDSLKKRYAEKEALSNRQAELENNKENVEAKNAYVTAASRNSSPFILISSLYKHIADKSTAVLLMDCRSAQAYLESKINFSNIINIPEESIRNGHSADKLSRELSPNDQILWNKRGEMDSIILIDEETSEQEKMNSLKPIWVLHGILTNWDQDVIYKSIQVADGGFDKFLTTYPMYTTNPSYKLKSSIPAEIYPRLEGIEYPSFDDIKMKPKEIPKYIPRIDRLSKPSGYGKTLPGNTAAPINPIALAREKEMMFDQALKKEQEVLTIGDELKRFASTPTIPNDVDQTEWYHKQSELEYKFIQKEHELNETISELNAVDQQEVENQIGTLQINKQSPELAEIKARLDVKQKEFTQYERKVAETKQVVEAKMNVFRERQKRHLQQKEEEDELTRPKIPAIDRSSKPTFDRSAPVQQVVYRDYSPEHGSYGEIGATGLRNLGNTCYMNSIIQCLLNIEGFCKYLTNDDSYMRHLNQKSKTRGQITVELAHLAKEIWSGKYKSVAPRDFRSMFGQEYKMFASYEQQDSHEFLVHLLDVLHSELQINDANVNAKADQGELAWREFVKNKNSIIQAMFYGQIRSTLKCCSCGFESATYDGFSHLSLELPQNSRQCYLHDCLDLYFNGEAIDGWTCPQCKSNRGAVKKLDISRLPPILVIHFKRFFVSTSSNSIEKKQNFVHFPIVDFQTVDYVMPSVKQRQRSLYNLIGVSNHYGTLNRGHYTAFCKNSKSKLWYKYDDNYVTQISSDDVDSSAGYILFYSIY